MIEIFINAAKVLAKDFNDADACVAKAIIQAEAPSQRQIEMLKRILARYPEHLERAGVRPEDMAAPVKVPERVVHDPPDQAPARKRIRLLPVETK
jgi:hypothetical protein